MDSSIQNYLRPSSKVMISVVMWINFGVLRNQLQSWLFLAPHSHVTVIYNFSPQTGMHFQFPEKNITMGLLNYSHRKGCKIRSSRVRIHFTTAMTYDSHRQTQLRSKPRAISNYGASRASVKPEFCSYKKAARRPWVNRSFSILGRRKWQTTCEKCCPENCRTVSI